MDYKLHTFLILCETMNYRITAEKLHLTQPAVTKQIQNLEQMYDTKLFTYDGKKLLKTENCHILEKYAVSLRYNYNELEKALHKEVDKKLRIGATKTIGEYVIGGMINHYIKSTRNNVFLEVDNTHHLLSMLNMNELDFAIVEGIFDKQGYDFKLFRKEEFIGICSKDSELNNRTVNVEELFSYNLIVREDGSGTRDILEKELKELGYSLNSFGEVSEISSFKIISDLVANNLGISFVYKAVHDDNSDLGIFYVTDFRNVHEFNTVWLKNTNAYKLADEFLKSDC